MIVKPGKYAPVGAMINERISPKAPTIAAGIGPNITPVTAMGRNAALSFTLFPKNGSVLFAKNPRTIRSASSIAIAARA